MVDKPHNVACVIAKFDNPGTSLNIPEHAGHVTGTGNNLAVIDKSAATEVSRVSAELTGAFEVGAVCLVVVKVVDGADVVQTAASDKVSRRRIGTGHDPTGAQRDSVHLVGGIGVPDDELSILRGRNQMPAIGGPVHGINLGKMTAEGSAGTHDDTRKGIDFSRHGPHCDSFQSNDNR